jgi:plastocyanin
MSASAGTPHDGMFMQRNLIAILVISLPIALIVSTTGCGGSVQAGPEPNMTAALKIRSGFKSAGPAKTPGGETGGAELKRLDGWATVRGRFVLDAALPAPAPIEVTKDQEVCGVHPLFNESIVTKGNALANVVVFVRTPKIPIHDDYKQSATATVTVDNKDCRFEPHVSHVRVGQTLLVHNSDSVAHNTNIAGKALQANPLIPAKSENQFKVEAPEQTPIGLSCNIHPWMKGRVVVTSNPYCAISKDDGTFELKNLPAGELEFQIWQEAANNLDVSNPKLQKTGAGRYKISLQPKDDVDLKDIVVPVAALKAG